MIDYFGELIFELIFAALLFCIIFSLFARNSFYIYKFSNGGIDIKRFFKVYRMNFNDITNSQVIDSRSDLTSFRSESVSRKSVRVLMDKLYPTEALIIATNGRIQIWILSTTPLDYIKENVSKINIDDRRV